MYNNIENELVDRPTMKGYALKSESVAEFEKQLDKNSDDSESDELNLEKIDNGQDYWVEIDKCINADSRVNSA